ncbi:MAG: glycoside hydrolase family 31 protein [Clostridia bacterium]|nr:glycoside hydrolase family 31 protein [Clostridia bacterium]
MFSSKGYLNLKIVAMLLAFLAGIKPFGDLLFYGRDVEILNASKITEQPAARNDGCGVDFTVSGNNEDIRCTLSFCGKEGWRLQSAHNGKISDRGAAQMLSYYLDEEDPCTFEPVSVSGSSNKTLLRAADNSSAEILYSPFRITFYSPSGAESAQINNIAVSDGNTIIRGSLQREEALWGAGEHFDHVNQRGQHVEINAIDEWAQTKGNSYMPIPILISSRGSGLFMNRYERMTIDADSRIVPKNTWQFCVFDAPCDMFIYTTEKPSDVLFGYSLLTGFAPEPAEWSYGSIICRYYPDFSTVDGVLDMARNMAENDFPWEGVIVEGFNAADDGELKRMDVAVHGLDKKLMVYSQTGSNPFRSLTDETAYLVRNGITGSINLVPANSDNPADNPDAGSWRFLDITSSEVRDYIYGRIWENKVKNYGVDGAKVDFCELFPDTYDLILADGTVSGAHHWYPVVYNALLYDSLSRNPTGTMTINRGGSIGAQRYPWIWLGDQKREFIFLQAQVKGLLSSGISGVPFVTCDMAGYKNAGEDEAHVFRRAVEFTAFIGNIQTHGDVKRAYDFDDETKAIYRKYAKIHDALRPYLVEQGKISCSTGLPLVRHLALDYWTDSSVWNVEDEFMLGNKFLVAPILDSGKYRNIYLPEGNWSDLWTGKKYTGGRTLIAYSVREDEIAVFVNEDHDSASFDACIQDVIAIYNGN